MTLIFKHCLHRMKTLCLIATLFFCASTMQAQFHSAPAFPGAEGFGRYTTGGRGGQVIHVTNLNDDGDGSLRAAIKTSGARIIVFDVAGIIELQSDLKIEKDNCTILGQTAPGDGICLRNYTFHINANNVIVRYIRCRMGDTEQNENDAMSASHKTGSYKKNIIIDHCSVSWCVDECASFYGNEDFTLQWCILSESLRKSVHDKGDHGYGGIWGGDKASFHHNLLAHHDSRNPRFDHGYLAEHAGIVDYINNVVYNWGGNSTYGGENKSGLEPKKFNMINNYYKPGPYTATTSRSNRLLNPTTKCSNCNNSDQYDVVPGKFYINGNKVNGTTVSLTTSSTSCSNISFDSGYDFSSFKANCIANSRYISSDEDFSSYNTISLHSADNAFTKTVQYAGASLSRDTVDARIAYETTNGTYTYTGSNGSTNGFIDTQSDVGGWPTYSGTALTDNDNDGIPDDWETAHGLSDNVNNAATYNLDSRGYYTDLEVYANYLVEDITKAERAGASASFEEYYPLDEQSEQNEQSNPEDDISGTLFSLTTTATSDITINGKSTIDLANYATVTGGTASLYNGHNDAKVYIKSSGITLGGSGNSYVKIELDHALQPGDILTTTGGDGGFVASVYTNGSSSNISGNTFEFTSDFTGIRTLYIMRGASPYPTFSSVTITRPGTTCALTDGEEYTLTADKTYDEVTFTKNFSTSLVNKWTALYVPFAIDIDDYTDAFDIAEINAFRPYRDTNGDGVVNDDDDDMLIVTKVTTGTTLPNTPYLIRAKADGDVTIIPVDNKLYAAANGQKVCQTNNGTYTFTGLNSSVIATPANNYYYMSNGTISHRTTGETTIKPNRWYMTVSGATNTNAKPSFSIIVEGEEYQPTAVTVNEARKVNTPSATYSVGGLHLSDTQAAPKGIYIQDRKKYIRK